MLANQFEPRKNIARQRLKVPKWHERKQQQKQELPKEISFDDLTFLDKKALFKGKEYELAKYNENELAVDYDNLVAYPMKKKGGLSIANPIAINEMQRKKKFIISEEEEAKAIKSILNEVFYPTAEKVIHITNYLDKNFARQQLDSLDANGYPTKENTVVWMSAERQPLKTLNMKELLRLLDDKFQKIMSNKQDRRNFLKQVIKDWYFKKIKNGILTVNFIK